MTKFFIHLLRRRFQFLFSQNIEADIQVHPFIEDNNKG